MTDPYDVDVRSMGSREELVAFVRLLADDLVANAAAWENRTAGAFLGALAAWLGSADSWAANMAEHRPDLWMDVEAPSWQLFAEALRVARTYE